MMDVFVWTVHPHTNHTLPPYSCAQDVCICNQAQIQTAYNSADAAANALHLTVAGSIVM